MNKKERDRQYYLLNKEKILAANLRWKMANPEKIKAINDRSRLKNIEKVRARSLEWYYKDRENILANMKTPEVRKRRAELQKRKYHANHSEIRKYMNEWQRGEKSKEYQRNYYHSHRDKFRIKDKIHNARRRSAGYLTKSDVQKIYEDNILLYGALTCYLCNEKIEFGKDHLDHKMPISKGGITEISNMGVACPSCNLRKNNKTVDEFMEVLNGRR
jgi:5-methylcytosine-specific restriction endonuclease McrA